MLIFSICFQIDGLEKIMLLDTERTQFKLLNINVSLRKIYV